jgi:hypothetical protein
MDTKQNEMNEYTDYKKKKTEEEIRFKWLRAKRVTLAKHVCERRAPNVTLTL